MESIKQVSVQEAIANFRPLYEYSRDLYARDNVELTVEEYVGYQIALTVPIMGTDKQWIKIDEPLVVFESNGKQYLASGNSRMQTIARMIAGGSTEEFAPVSYRILEKWDDEELQRYQYITNDSGRKNSRLRKMRQIASYIERTVKSGVEVAIAKKQARVKFALSATEVKNACLISNENVPPFLNDYLDKGLIKTDPAIELINIKNVLGIEPQVVIADLIAKDIVLSLPKIVAWRADYVKKSQAPKAVVENYINDGEKTTVSNSLPSTVSVSTGSTASSPKSDKKLVTPKSNFETKPAPVDDAYVPMGKYKLETDTDAFKACYVLSVLFSKEQLDYRKDEVKAKVFDLMNELQDLQLPPNIASAITNAMK